jgi:rhodanese-related sulfurtransferase
MTIQELLKNGAQVVDVRSADEFMGGNVSGSINIPLNEVPERIAEFKNIERPIVLCCLAEAEVVKRQAFYKAKELSVLTAVAGWTLIMQ